VFVNQLHRVPIDGRAEIKAAGGAERLPSRIRTGAPFARLSFVFRRQEAPVTATAGWPHSSQKLRTRQIRQFAEGATAEGPDEFAIEPDIPALTQPLASPHNRMIATCDDPPFRSLKLPGPEGGIAVWPVDPTLFHKQ